jgi:putative membrane protein
MRNDAGNPKNESRASAVKEDFILRDRLAIDRTVLANERTLLSYVRTALTLFLVGMSFIHVPMFNPDPDFGGLAYGLTGWLFVVGAGATALIGHLRYRRFRGRALKAADLARRTEEGVSVD